MCPRAHSPFSIVAICCALLLRCTQQTPNSPVDIDPMIAIPHDALVVAYSVLYEWSSEVHLIIDGTDTRLFPDDTVTRRNPALNREASRIAYLTGGEVWCGTGCTEFPGLAVANLTTGEETTVLEPQDGVSLGEPEWLDDETIVLFTREDGALSLLLVKTDGTVRNTLALGNASMSSARILRSPNPAYTHVYLGWDDTTAVLLGVSSMIGRKPGFGPITGGPIANGDTVLLQTGYRSPRYRMYARDGAYLGDTVFTVALNMPGDDPMVLDSARVVWLDSSRLIVMRGPNDTGTAVSDHRLYLCERGGSALGTARIPQPECFLPYYDGESMYLVSESFGDDAYAVVRQQLLPRFEGNGFEVLTMVRDDHFILHISLYEPL